jgi:tetratricopeptide (TPR) repeat protein
LFLVRAGLADEAEKAYTQAAARGVESPFLLMGLGLTQLTRGQADGARSTFTRLTESGDAYRSSLGRLYLAQADAYEGKLAAAAAALQAGLQLDLKSENMANALLRRYSLGRVFLLQGKDSLARKEANAIAGTAEQHLFAQHLYQAGTLFVRLGDLDAARQAARRLSRLREQMPTSFHQAMLAVLQGEIALARGQLQAALDAFQSAVAEYRVYPALEGAAQVHARREQWTQARAAWEQVIASKGEILHVGFAPDLLLAHFQLARVCQRAADTSCARAHYETVSKVWQRGDDLAVRRDADDALRRLIGGQ